MRVRHAWSRVLLPVALACAQGSTAMARDEVPGVPDGFFPFVIPWDDASAGTATDVSFLNSRPAGAGGRIVVRDGHFVESRTGKRVRFVGVNGPSFPDHAEAEKLAAHLAKAGVNLVRLHNMDNKGNWGVDGTLLDLDRDDTQHFNKRILDRFDYLVAQLKRHGIYVGFQVQVNRQLKKGDGIADNPLFGKAMKRYDRFSERWIELQQKWARDLLTRVNRYTGRRLVDDPVMATVEINNENSILQEFNEVPALESAPEPYRSELKRLWNEWLRRRYSRDRRMLAAWNRGAGLGPSILGPRDRWVEERRLATKLSIAPDAEAAAPSAGEPAAPAVRVSVEAPPGTTDWHGQAHVTGITLKDGELYTLSFRIRSDRPRPGNVRICRDRAQWENFGIKRDVKIAPEWRAHRFTFTAQNPEPEHARVSFILGGETAEFRIADLRLQVGFASGELPAGQSLADASIELGWGTPERNRDWMRFLVGLDRSYAERMRTFLVRDLGVKAPVADSQITYGRLSGLNREAEMDYTDVHGYWQHPYFEGKAWDPGNWKILNIPQVDTFLGRGARGIRPSLYRDFSCCRVAGRPFVVSEYDHPAPSDYAAEMLPEMATFASLQDWDGFYIFAINNHGPYDRGRMEGFFEVLGHPGKFGYLPQAALIFRTGVFPAAPGRATLHVSDGMWVDRNVSFVDTWRDALKGAELPDILCFRTEIAQRLLSAHASPRVSWSGRERPDDSVAVRRTAGGAAYLARSDACGVIVGAAEGETLSAGALEIRGARTAGGFVSASLVSTDSKPVAESERLLLTIGGRFSNVGMRWNADRTSVGRAWGGGPSIASAVDAEVACAVSGPREVYALSETGARVEAIPATYADGKLAFRITPAQRTIWYEIVPRAAR